MKHLFAFFGLLFLMARTSFAYPPMEPRPLKERVELSTQIFIGTIERVIAVDNDKDFRELRDAEIPDISNYFLLEVRVQESLTSPQWHPTKPILIGNGGFWTDLKIMKANPQKQSFIFLTTMSHVPHWGPVLTPSYGYFLTETLDKKAEIQKLLKTNEESADLWNQFNQLAQYLRDAESIQISDTRKKVGKLLHHVKQLEGTKEKYIFNRTPYVALDIEFALHDPKRSDELDTVVSVSKPYLEWPDR